MNCPSCASPLESNARFCGVCGYRLQPGRPATPAAAPSAAGARPQASAGSSPAIARAPQAQPQAQRPQQQPKPQHKSRSRADDLYINTVLNNRFKVESKIGEGGFGAVYRGTQLATGRKVALKLLHPEMTKDENLVARFRREGMVLCNLRDAHTITTYDFDQTPDGTLYIAMELLEGKSLHHVFHEQAPLEWKRVFKILTEMCSSLAEAHQQGIVHRDLKPENIYLETRPGNPEFVKILDFGIAKVMRGDSIDPQSPQLTATGQTLGTLEYMSPEQLMGKALDGRSDVYALGVVAYEMITGRLPFPDAKGPAGLITAQLKQTPQPPSVANPKANLPKSADAVILKCLEKDKNNRYPDVQSLSLALQDVIAHASSDASKSQPRIPGADLLETRTDAKIVGVPPSMPGMGPPGMGPPGMGHPGMGPPPMGAPSMGAPAQSPFAVQSSPNIAPLDAGASMQYAPPNRAQTPYPVPSAPQPTPTPTPAPTPYPMQPMQPMQGMQPQASVANMHAQPPVPAAPVPASSSKWIWWVVALLVLGAGAGAVLALIMK
ncbi:MAG: serine/threonine-protein kinase [Kofleriaceae bacterium]|nr:serine/threonine-protein kinase [Kofleriaceae bacterium]